MQWYANQILLAFPLSTAQAQHGAFDVLLIPTSNSTSLLPNSDQQHNNSNKQTYPMLLLLGMRLFRTNSFFAGEHLQQNNNKIVTKTANSPKFISIIDVKSNYQMNLAKSSSSSYFSIEIQWHLLKINQIF